MARLNDSIPGDSGHEHPDEFALSAYLDGSLEGQALEEIEGHLAECRECRAMLAGTVRVLDQPAGSPTGVPRSSPRWTRHLIPVAIAASIGAIVLARTDTAPNAGLDDRVRSALPARPGSEGLGLISAYAPATGDTVAARGLTFAWGATPAERYRFVLVDDEGTPLWSVNTNDTTVALPDSVVLRPGRLHFWHVDAVGGGLAATTRMLRFTTAPVP